MSYIEKKYGDKYFLHISVHAQIAPTPGYYIPASTGGVTIHVQTVHTY